MEEQRRRREAGGGGGDEELEELYRHNITAGRKGMELKCFACDISFTAILYTATIVALRWLKG